MDGLADIHGDVLDDLTGKGGQLIQHPRREKEESQKDCNNFRNKGQGHLLNGGDRLKNAHRQPNNESQP